MSVTVRFSWCAFLSRDLAPGMSCCRCSELSKSASYGAKMSLATTPKPFSAESISCCRPTRRRKAWRTLLSLKGAWSMRMVNGLNCPVCEATAFTPEVFASAAICGGSSWPAAWMTLVVRASWTAVLSLKSVIVRVSA